MRGHTCAMLTIPRLPPMMSSMIWLSLCSFVLSAMGVFFSRTLSTKATLPLYVHTCKPRSAIQVCPARSKKPALGVEGSVKGCSVMQDKHRQGQQMRTAAERTLQPLFISSFVTSASLPALSGPDSSITVDSGDACTPSSAQCAGSQAQQELLGRDEQCNICRVRGASL